MYYISIVSPIIYIHIILRIYATYPNYGFLMSPTYLSMWMKKTQREKPLAVLECLGLGGNHP